MGWLGTVLREVWGLFVDDVSFAAAIVVWVGLVWVLMRFGFGGWGAGLVLFAGLGVVLAGSLWRFARGGVR